MDTDTKTDSKPDQGARIDLNVNLSHYDCFVMCKQLFVVLNEEEQQEVIDNSSKTEVILSEDKEV